MRIYGISASSSNGIWVVLGEGSVVSVAAVAGAEMMAKVPYLIPSFFVVIVVV